MSTDFPVSPGAAALDDCWNRIGVRGDGSCPELKRHVHCRNCPVYSAAATRRLEAGLPAGHLDEWTAHFARPQVAGATGLQSVVIFRLGVEWLALPTAVFKEVAASRVIHSLPHRRNGAVLGLVNVRGELLVCVSLAAVLGVDRADVPKAGAGRARNRLLVISGEGGRLVFPVDEVHGIHACATADLQAVPATVAKAAATYTKSVFAWEKKTVGCLDDQLLCYTLNRRLG